MVDSSTEKIRRHTNKFGRKAGILEISVGSVQERIAQAQRKLNMMNIFHEQLRWT